MFEDSLISEYLYDTDGFWKYITETCVYSGETGLHILNAFKNRSFDKTFVHDRMNHRPRRFIPHTNRKQKLKEYYQKAYNIMRDAF